MKGLHGLLAAEGSTLCATDGPMNPRAVLFDMDGVLVKSDEVWFRVVEAAGQKFRGRKVTREEFFPTFGQGTAADISVFGLECSLAQLDAFYVDAFLDHLHEMWVNPDAAPLLGRLAAHGVRCALVTNTVMPLARRILRRAGLIEAFDSLATADRVGEAKPAPDLVFLALRELGVEVGDVWMVGDSRFDRQAARAAGVHFVGLALDGDRRIERLSELMS
jgi:HAD superfamily hydrolase (TIGR01509 family)